MQLRTLVLSAEKLKELSTKKMPVITSFKFGLFLKKVMNFIEQFEITRLEKVKEYGEELKGKDDKPTNNWQVTEENIEKFKEEMENLLNEEVDLEVFSLKLADINEKEMSPDFFMDLDWLIKE